MSVLRSQKSWVLTLVPVAVFGVFYLLGRYTHIPGSPPEDRLPAQQQGVTQ